VREREEIERSWDVPGNTAVPNVDVGLLHPAVGRPSTVSPSPRSGAVNAKQPNANSASAPVNNPAPSSAGRLAATVLPPPPGGNNNKSKAAKSKPAPNGPNAQVSVPPATTQANGAAIAAIVETVRNHSHPNGNGSATTTDRNEFVREVLTLIHVRRRSSTYYVALHSFTFIFGSIDRFVVRGPTLDGISCAGLAYVRRPFISIGERTVATTVTCTCPSSSHSFPSHAPSAFPRAPTPMLHRDIIVHVLSHDVPTLAPTCIDIFDAVFSGGCVL
jgi:hypothetical protein